MHNNEVTDECCHCLSFTCSANKDAPAAPHFFIKSTLHACCNQVVITRMRQLHRNFCVRCLIRGGGHAAEQELNGGGADCG